MSAPVGLVLAGGASRRMGQDKALMPILGEAMASRMARLMVEAGCGSLWLVGRQTGLSELGWPVLSEAEDAPRHPLSGVAAGLARAAEEGASLALIAACDLVSIQAEDLRLLLMAGQPQVAEADGQLQPLLALLPTAWASKAAVLAAQGRSATALVEGLARIQLPPRAAHNANRPEDLPLLRRSAQ